MTDDLAAEARLEWFLASGFFAGGAAAFVAAQVMFYVGSGNSFSFWLTATVISAVMAIFVATADAIGGMLGWFVLRRMREPMSRIARSVIAAGGMAVFSAVPAVMVCLVSPNLRGWWLIPVAGAGSSALCVAVVVACAKVKPSLPTPASDRRIPGIRL
jgi:uncharacterized protein YggT (Ycf19 family)